MAFREFFTAFLTLKPIPKECGKTCLRLGKSYFTRSSSSNETLSTHERPGNMPGRPLILVVFQCRLKLGFLLRPARQKFLFLAVS